MLIGYIRVSTAKQARDNESLPQQSHLISQWASQHPECGTPTIIEDAGISGSTIDDRPGFLSALRKCLVAGSQATLVACALDRMGRSTADCLDVSATLFHRGVRLVLLRDGIDTSTALGKMWATQMLPFAAMLAEGERRLIVERLQAGRAKFRARGDRYSHHVHYGFSDESERANVELIRSLRASGLSYPAIAEHLRRQAISPRTPGASWSLSLLHSIATGKRYQAKPRASARVQRTMDLIMGSERSTPD